MALTSGVIKQTEIQLFLPVLGAASPAEAGLGTGSGAATRHLASEGWRRGRARRAAQDVLVPLLRPAGITLPSYSANKN